MNTLDIFYKEIIPEASRGNIKSFFTYNILFETYLKEDNIKIDSKVKGNGVITPLLIINNKSVFNELLNEYVDLAIEFYKDSNYLNDIEVSSFLLNEDVNVRKNIIAMLWSNATLDDFSNPIEFLKRRIDFINSEVQESIIDYGELDIFDGKLKIEIKKDEIYNETPYLMDINLTNDEGLIFNFPSIKFGVSNNTLFIYAIQNYENNKNNYAKKINRLLYKINDGFDDRIDTPDIYGLDNLKDITASFLVAINIGLSYFKNLNISEVIVSSVLLPRWNAKRIAITKKENNSGKYDELVNEQIRIQKNLTEKFLRTFLRLNVHYDGINITAYPFDIDSNLHLDISDMNISNNKLLQLTNDIIKDNKNKNL